MRPPSYYNSIVKSNTGHSPYASSYSSSSSSDYSTTTSSLGPPRTSSQQLRTSFSSPSSSSYVSRSHLPFVPQSTLVAHCFTGVGSSTRPYGGGGGGGSTSSSYLGSRAGLSASGSSSASTLSSGYGSSSLASYARPASTKRTSHYSSPSSYSSSSSSSYLSPSSALSAASRYRPSPTTSSSYYKPIRLRERPLLTQISRQINGATTPTRSTRLASSTATTTTPSPKSHSTASEPETKSDNGESRGAKLTLPTSEDSRGDDTQTQEECNWSSDIGRNISRNKYLIKFREIDKGRPSLVDIEPATIQLASNATGQAHGRDSCVPDRETPAGDTQVSFVVEHTMRLPTAEASSAAGAKLEDEEARAVKKEKELECDNNSQEEPAKTPVVKKEVRKNVKLKLKPIAAGGKKKKTETSTEATTTTTIRETAAARESVAPQEPEPEPEKVTKTEADVAEPRKVEKHNTIVPAPAPVPPAPILTPAGPVEPVKVDEKRKIAIKKTSATKAKTKEAGQGSNKLTEPGKEIPSAEATAPTPTPVTPPVVPTSSPKIRPASKVKKGSKVLVESTNREQPVPPTAATKEAKQPEEEKPKTKIVKKKKKPKDGEGEEGPAVARRRKASSAAKKEVPASEPEQQAPTAVVQEVASPATPSTRQPPGRIRFREYNIHDFNFLTVLGHGGWGFVILAELREHDACFAVKCIKKITIVEDDDYDSIMIERKVLTLGNIHPFICKLFCTFETPGYLFFVMEYCAGGDLMFHVQHEGKFTESRCRFYAAEIICAIRFLHNRHIIYRDLKLDNILLDSKGHIRLVDFGMCQCRTYREEMLPSNFCGTPEYISPEIIKGVPYNHSVDWWSFGVLLYEMAVGKMPFRGNDENELLWNVCYEQIHYPMFLTKELTSLLKSLLEREPTKRMGMATCKAGDIYEQPFFRTVDWKAVEELRVEPPFVPEVRSNRDVSNFDSDFTESTCELSPVDESTLARIDQKQFAKFPYTNPDIFIFDPTQQDDLHTRQRSTAIL